MTRERRAPDSLSLDELLFLVLKGKGKADGGLFEPIWEFNGAEIARALDEIRKRRMTFSSSDYLFIDCLASAFRDQDEKWKISVTRRGKAPVTSFQQNKSLFIRNAGISLFIASRLDEGVKLEAAIAEATQSSGLKRAALFKIWRKNRNQSIAFINREKERGFIGKLWDRLTGY